MLLIKVKEEGRTIVEVVAVLVIMLILTLGGLYLYERIVAKLGAKDLAEEVATLATKNRIELTHSERVSEKSTKREGRGKLSSSPENNGKDFSILVEPESKIVCDELSRTDLLANAGVVKKYDECPKSITFYFKGDFSDAGPSGNGFGGGVGGGVHRDDSCPDPHAITCDKKGRSTLCEEGYYLYDNRCVSCPEGCICDGKAILGAKEGYYQEGYQCFACGPGVKRCTKEQPISCLDDYYLDEGECKKCPNYSTTTEYSQHKVPNTSCYCKIGYRLDGGRCIPGCETSADCPNEKPVCYANKQCGACESNYGGSPHPCPTEILPLCKNGKCESCSIGTVWNTTKGTCTECSSTDLSKCPTDKPYCKNDEGICVACLGNYGTGDGSCLSEDTPICQNNVCVSCATIDPTKPYWKETVCVECLEHTHCQEGKKCSDGNSCQDCEQNTFCPTCPTETPYWDGTKCVVCLSYTDCGDDKYCTTDKICADCDTTSIVEKCSIESDMRDEITHCLKEKKITCEGDTPVCKTEKETCVGCLANYASGSEGACPTEEYPVCDTNTGTCEACSGTTPYWNGQKCVECLASYGSGETGACQTAEKPSCSPEGICLACLCEQEIAWRGSHSVGNDLSTCIVENTNGKTPVSCPHWKNTSGCTYQVSIKGTTSHNTLFQVFNGKKVDKTYISYSKFNYPERTYIADLKPAQELSIRSGVDKVTFKSDLYVYLNHPTSCGCSGNKPHWNGQKCVECRNDADCAGRADGKNICDITSDSCVVCPEHSSKTVTSWQIGKTGCYCEEGYVVNDEGTGCSTGCRSYNDCETGQYCRINATECTTPKVGTCQPINNTTSGFAFTLNDKGFIESNDRTLNWWSANDYCQAQGMFLPAPSDLGLTAGYETGCCGTGTSCGESGCLGENTGYHECVGPDWNWLRQAPRLGAHYEQFWIQNHSNGCCGEAIHPWYNSFTVDYHHGEKTALCAKVVPCPPNSSTTVREGARIGTTACYCNAGYIPNAAGTGCQEGCLSNAECGSCGLCKGGVCEDKTVVTTYKALQGNCCVDNVSYCSLTEAVPDECGGNLEETISCSGSYRTNLRTGKPVPQRNICKIKDLCTGAIFQREGGKGCPSGYTYVARGRDKSNYCRGKGR